MKFSTLFLILLVGGDPLAVTSQMAEVCESELPYKYDSGETNSAVTHEVRRDGAPWIQLDLTRTELAPKARLVLTSGSDPSRAETLTASSLASSNGWSGVFDGESIVVELVVKGGGGGGNIFLGKGVSGGSTSSRVVVSSIKAGVCEDRPPASICGETDDRVPSQDERAGRIGGCTGWLISPNVFLQAGHCGAPSSSTRIHFAYGVGNASMEDQYAVVPGSYRSSDDFGGTSYGHDFGIGRLQPNSVTGMLPGEAQGDWFTLGQVPGSTAGVTMRVTGYGTAEVDSRSQKTHTGDLVQIVGSGDQWLIKYTMDTTGGNSGSPAIHDETGFAIGIHTHGGCSATGGSNAGTRIDHPDLASLLELYLNPCGGDADCDDGDIANGLETCVDGICRSGEAPTQAPTTCDGVYLEVDITTDNYPTETSYVLTNTCSNREVARVPAGSFTSANKPYANLYCVDPNNAFDFAIGDTYGDGICCGFGIGSYQITYEGQPYDSPSGGVFGGGETLSFGTCGPATPTTSSPTDAPTPPPTREPTKEPTSPPTRLPTKEPTNAPTDMPVPTNPPMAPPTVTRYRCHKRQPSDGDICTNGNLIRDGSRCQNQGDRCGKGRRCWLATCDA